MEEKDDREIEALKVDLARRENELQRIDRQIDRIQHALRSSAFPGHAFIGSGGMLASAFRRKKGLQESLEARRAARSIAVQQLKKTKARLDLALIGEAADE